MAKLKTFEVPKQDATPIKVVPTVALEAAANDDIPLRDRPPVVEAPGLMLNISRTHILITGAALAAFTTWAMIRVFLFVAWLFGLGAVEHHFVALGGLQGVLRAIGGFATGVSILCGGLFLWAAYNWVRFHGPDRRRAPPPISDLRIAEHYDLPAPYVWRWQYAKWLRAHHDDHGVVIGAESSVGTWIRDKEDPHPVIKPNTFDILYLSARSKMWRKSARARRELVSTD